MSIRTICAQHSHPSNPERAETRSCPKRAISILSLEGELDWSPTARVQRGSSQDKECQVLQSNIARHDIVLETTCLAADSS
jgi:hypothetical protein